MANETQPNHTRNYICKYNFRGPRANRRKKADAGNVLFFFIGTINCCFKVENGMGSRIWKWLYEHP